MTLCCVDENGKDTDKPIVFSEWAFITGSMLQRSDYTFAELLAKDESDTKTQTSFLDKDADSEGVFLKKYVSHYRRVQENG